MGYGNLKRAVLCNLKETYFDAADSEAHNLNKGIDKEQALLQFGKLKDTLKETGVKIAEIPELKDHPNSIFVKDTAVITKNGFVKLRMGLKSSLRLSKK